MPQFKRLADNMYVAPQLSPDDIARAASEGFSLIVNNRPDDEEAGQPSSFDLEQAAKAHGLAYRSIPVGGGGFGMPQVEALANALQDAQGKTLAFCRSGTRSTMLWALAQATRGQDTDSIAQAAQAAGYDVQAIRPTLDLLVRQNGGA